MALFRLFRNILVESKTNPILRKRKDIQWLSTLVCGILNDFFEKAAKDPTEFIRALFPRAKSRQETLQRSKRATLYGANGSDDEVKNALLVSCELRCYYLIALKKIHFFFFYMNYLIM